MSGHISSDKIVVIETRRRWSDEERRQAVEETQHMAVSAVARKFGMAKSLLFRWRKEAGIATKRRPIAPFVPVRIAVSSASPMSMPPTEVPQASATPSAGTIEIELAGGYKLRIRSPIDVQALKQVIAVLRD
ncbi:MAG: transposase [Aestuariivirga sp.]